jgi:hypothetical protein
MGGRSGRAMLGCVTPVDFIRKRGHGPNGQRISNPTTRAASCACAWRIRRMGRWWERSQKLFVSLRGACPDCSRTSMIARSQRE